MSDAIESLGFKYEKEPIFTTHKINHHHKKLIKNELEHRVYFTIIQSATANNCSELLVIHCNSTFSCVHQAITFKCHTGHKVSHKKDVSTVH